MTSFERSFDVKRLAEWDRNHPTNAVRELLNHWALPGFFSDQERMLRIGVRRKYVNLYVAGQSVAKLSCGQKGPRVEVHQKYVDGRRSGSVPDSALDKQTYVRFDAAALTAKEVIARIPGWIETAETYGGAEKRFVDRVIGANPGVIDLEVGLPADEMAGKEKSAPRMDLVLAQPDAGGSFAIAFWEAKCSINPELRAEAEYSEKDGLYEKGPKVIHQLRKYQNWVSQKVRHDEVQQAYIDTANILLEFYSSFGAALASEPACLSIWRKLAGATSKPEVIRAPGVVIGNYCPTSHEPTKATDVALFARHAESFTDHRNKLKAHNIKILEVKAGEDIHVLPPLLQCEVAACRSR